MQKYGTYETTVWKCDNGDYVLHSEAQAEIDRLTAERDEAVVDAEFFKGEVKLRNRILSTNDTAASLQAEVERLQLVACDGLNAFSSVLAFVDSDYDIKLSDDFVDNFNIVARAIRDTAWNDAIEAAARAADDARKSPESAGMGMAPVLDAIRTLKRPPAQGPTIIKIVSED